MNKSADFDELPGMNSTQDLPLDMRFNDGHVVSIVMYSILMVISIIGNSTVLFLILQRRRSNRSRINTMLMHLAVADLLVTVLVMPLEIGWAATVSWHAGDAMCRIMAFFRIFGIYLSGFILVCISIDRYYAVLKPLQLMDVDRRGKIMLVGAWIASLVCSAPQSVVFHVEAHPNFTWYEQCIAMNTFPSRSQELAYAVFGMMMMYWLPLTVIIYTYSSILLEIYRKTKEAGGDRIRRSSLGFLGRAKIRTLKMTVIIVVVFFVCWTPYYIMSVWYWFDYESAKQVDLRIQRFLFLFACTNSCMNPIVYGAFNIRRNAQLNMPYCEEIECFARARRPITLAQLGKRHQSRMSSAVFPGAGQKQNQPVIPIIRIPASVSILPINCHTALEKIMRLVTAAKYEAKDGRNESAK